MLSALSHLCSPQDLAFKKASADTEACLWTCIYKHTALETLTVVWNLLAHCSACPCSLDVLDSGLDLG